MPYPFLQSMCPMDKINNVWLIMSHGDINIVVLKKKKNENQVIF